MGIGIIGNGYDRSTSAIGDCQYSTGLNYFDHNRCEVWRDWRTVTRFTNVRLGKGGIKDNLQVHENEDLMYFMLQVNLLTNRVEFIGKPFENSPNPGFSIREMEKPFRVGISIICKVRNSIGLGIVRVR